MTIPETVVGHLVVATEEVFETMVFKPVIRGALLGGDAVRPPSNVVATVAFAGHRRGLVAFHSSLGAAREIAASMLGLEPETVNGEMPDARSSPRSSRRPRLRSRRSRSGRTSPPNTGAP